MARYIVFFIASLATMDGLLAQSEPAIMYTPFFNQFHNLEQSVNPAYRSTDALNTTSLGLQVHTGAFSNFRNAFFGTNISIKPEANKTQLVGLMVKNESEGKLLNRNYYYGQYLILIPLNDKHKLGAGVQIGAASIIFQSTSITPGSSSFAPDANFGISLNSKNRILAIGFNQLFKSTLLNPGQTSVLNRYLNVVIDQKLELSDPWTARMVALYQSDNFNTMAFNMELTLIEKYGAGLGWNNRKGLGVGAFLNNYDLGKSILNLGLHYYTALGLRNNISIDEVEIVAGVSF